MATEGWIWIGNPFISSGSLAIKISSDKKFRILEMVEIDTNHFPLFDKEKYSYNIKIVDLDSYTSFVKDLKSSDY